MKARIRRTVGFTLVEMLIIAPIVLLTIGAFITAIVSMTGDVLASRSSTYLAYSIQDALSRIETDAKLSSSFLATNNITLSSPQGYNNSNSVKFTNVGSNGNMLILNHLATTGNPASLSNSLVYLADKPNACSVSPSSKLMNNTPMSINIVYFVKDNTLWRRTIVPSDYTTTGCNQTWQQPSCYPSLFTDGSWGSNTFCKTQDEKLIEGGTEPVTFDIQYYTSADSINPSSIAANSGSTDSARYAAMQSTPTVTISIDVNKTAAGRDISQSGSIRTTRLDINASTIAEVVPDVIPSAPSGVTATYELPGKITVNWYPNATTYNLQYDTSNSFSSPTTVSNISSASKTITGLNSARPRYYFRVQSTNSKGTSGWSSSANASSTIINGLVVWWPFNGNANDMSDSNYNGTINGATLTTGQNGQANGAYNFTTYVNDITSSTIPVMKTTLTLSAWIKPTNAPSERYTIMKGESASAYYLSMNTDKSLQIYWYYTSNVGYHSSGANTITLNAWNYVAATWDGTNARLYVNGVLKNTVAVTGTGRAATNLLVGAENSSRQYQGAMDDVRLYSRALSGTEISQLYSNGAR